MMTKCLRRCVLVGLLGALAVSGGRAAAPPKEEAVSGLNLVAHPGFETLDGRHPAGWTTGGPRRDVTPAFSSDTGFVRSGERSLCMSGEGKAGVVGWATTSCPGISPGHTYELAAYVRAEQVPSLRESAWVKLTWRRPGEDNLPRVAYLTRCEPDGGWWRFSGKLRAPEGATSAEITLGLRGAPHGRLWWDDVSLCRVPDLAPRHVRLATAYQPSTSRTDPDAWRNLIDLAGRARADVVCLGEMAQVVPDGLKGHPTVPGPATEALAELARRYQMMIIVSIPEWQGPLWYNTAVIIGKDGRLIGRYRKTHLPQNEVEAGSTAGGDLPVFGTEIGRIGVQICYDQFFPEVARALALQGAEIIFTPIWGDGRARNTIQEAVARTRAVDNSVYYVTSTYNEHSFIIAPDGTVLADTKGEPGVVFADVDLNQEYYEPWLSVTGEAEFRYLWPKERRPGLYERLTQDR